QEVVALARPLADAAEDGDAAVLQGDVVDELLDQDGLADTGAAKEAYLAAADVRSDQVDYLEARLEDLDRRRELAERGRVAMDRPPLALARLAAVDGIADHVPDPAERLVAHRHGDRLLGIDDLGPAREAVGRVHRNRAHAVVAEVLLHL